MQGNQAVMLGKIEAALTVAMDLHISSNCTGCLEFVALFPIDNQCCDIRFHCLLCNEKIQVWCKRG